MENDNTPKSRPTEYTTSTVAKKPLERKSKPTTLDFEKSLGILSLTNVDISHITEDKVSLSGLSSDLLKQRSLANMSLQRVSSNNTSSNNKVAGIPSKYFKPDLSGTAELTELAHRSTDSTISESDLLRSMKDIANISSKINRLSDVSESDLVRSIKDRSTPRNSIPDLGSSKRMSIAKMVQIFEDPSMNYNNCVEEFKRVMEGENNVLVDSGMFVPAEEAASRMQAAEVSWRKEYDLPTVQEISFTQCDAPSTMSIGAYFAPKSHDIADFGASISPEKDGPPARLIDESIATSSVIENTSQLSMSDLLNMEKSLSVSAIAKFISSNTDDSPNKLVNFLMKQTNKNAILEPLKERNTLEQPIPASPSSDSSATLPNSGNSSYTTNYSENEVLKDINNKENMSPLSSRATSRVSSSLTSLPDGKLPIDSTKSELVWGCVKVDKSASQEFIIRNKSSKTIKIQCKISGRDFRLRKDNRSDSEAQASTKLVLYGHESRPVIVSFMPTKIGAAFDELVFTPIDSSLVQTRKQCVKLFGYGGYANVQFENLMKDNTGKFWLSLGRLDNNSRSLERRFVVKNVGNLPAFATIEFRPNHMFAFSSLVVTPHFFTMLPDEDKEICITYTPNATDCKSLQPSLTLNVAASLGSLEVISGAEATRGRIRRLCRKYSEKSLIVNHLAENLKQKIVGEVMPSDLSVFKESTSSLKELLTMLHHSKIALTIEHDPDQTLVTQFADDSVMFQTLSLETGDSHNINDETNVDTNTEGSEAKYWLQPPVLFLNLPNKPEDNLFLVSNTEIAQTFRITSLPAGLKITPSKGVLKPGASIVVKVKYPANFDRRSFKVCVFIGEDVLESEVKIVVLGNSSNSGGSRLHFLK